METSPKQFATALASGESDRVNDAIDRAESIEAVDRVADYEALFDACRPVYETDDGYVRQSVVRFLRDAYPRLELRIGTSTADHVDGYTLEDLTEDRARLVTFLLEALKDDDGRVRRAAVDGIETLALAMAAAELYAEQQALADSLATLRENQPEEYQTHIERARRAVEDGPGAGALLSGIELPEDRFGVDERSQP